MSISAIKQALEALEDAEELLSAEDYSTAFQKEAITALRQAIAEAEKQEPLVWMNKYGHVASFKNDEYTAPLYTAPVHASDISQERVDETAKRKHEWVGLDDDIPGLGLVTEEFYNGMLCAEDILRKKNT
jgi:50S ribosomal subunit-associated GTPase HflX